MTRRVAGKSTDEDEAGMASTAPLATQHSNDSAEDGVFKQIAKAILPEPAKAFIRKSKAILPDAAKAFVRKFLPAARVFSDVYATNAWGGKLGELYSGSGSYGSAADLYVREINEFITSNSIRSVVDLGCGDYAIGRRIACDDYTGIDIVKAVIQRNEKEFGSRDRRFLRLNIASRVELPQADLCLIRQVLQHLSNKQIMSIINNIRDLYDFVVITEHHPSDTDFIACNVDKAHGASTRLAIGSGVYLDQPPFNVTAELLFEQPGNAASDNVWGRGPIRTYLARI